LDLEYEPLDVKEIGRTRFKGTASVKWIHLGRWIKIKWTKKEMERAAHHARVPAWFSGESGQMVNGAGLPRTSG
jgi:hypothetical protein